MAALQARMAGGGGSSSTSSSTPASTGPSKPIVELCEGNTKRMDIGKLIGNLEKEKKKTSAKTSGLSKVTPVKVVEGNPSTITVYKNDAGEAEAVAQLEEAFKESFEAQGWNIAESRILNLNDMPVYNIIASAEEGGKTLENNTSALINDGNMYVFELMHFKEFPYAYNDYLAIMDSIEFE